MGFRVRSRSDVDAMSLSMPIANTLTHSNSHATHMLGHVDMGMGMDMDMDMDLDMDMVDVQRVSKSKTQRATQNAASSNLNLLATPYRICCMHALKLESRI